MKVADLAYELRSTVKEVQAVARRLDIAAKHADHALGRGDCARIRETLLRERELARLPPLGAEPAEGDPEAKGPAEAPAPPRLPSGRDLPRPVIRRDPAPPRDESGVELWAHAELLEWLEAPTTDERQRRRARLVLWQLLSRGRPNNVKSLQGPGRGWLRTRLGGSSGNQFYLWWAPAGSQPIAEAGLPRGAVLLRAVRHHDDNDQLLEAGPPSSWLRLHARDALADRADYADSFTEQQTVAASAPQAVRLLKGHPGTGKTTALWLSTAFAEGHRALYLTYSRRLAAESEQHFRAFGPQGMSIDVLTFGELLAEFDGAPSTAPMLPPDEAGERLRALLGGFQQRRAPWEGHEAELYAELHAHYVGRALPVALRGRLAAAGPTMTPAEYVEERAPVLGAAAAKVAASIGEYLRRGTALRELMPGPLRARAALDALAAGRPLPPRLRELDWIFVDEAQDLTLVETLLVVELAALVGRERGMLPGFVAAGDEGQTVRPTDFEWGPLADLLTERLGVRSEYELSGNLRSPRNIATVINRSWELYRRLDKSERPRGYAEADVEETAVGRILLCRARDDSDVEVLLSAFARTPGSALVHPGYRVPDRWRVGAEAGVERSEPLVGLRGVPLVDLWTSDTAKGLDFQVVGVLDAGRQLSRLHALAEQAEQGGRIFALWARALADQLRVALSRATDTLVLIDRASDEEAAAGGAVARGDEEARALLYQLCRGEGDAPLDGFLEEMEPRELAELLAREDEGAEALVVGYLQEIPKLLQDRPQRALRQARNASGLLGGEKTPGAVVDVGLRKQVHRLRGVAALLSATDGQTPEAERAEQFREANLWLHRAGLPEAARAALWLRNILAFGSGQREEGAGAQDAALGLSRSLDRLAQEIAEADAVLRRGIVAWCRAVAGATPPTGIAAKRKLADAVGELAAQLGGRHPELVAHRETVRRRVGLALLEEGHAREALAQLELLAERDLPSEGRCFEALEEWAAGADRFELAGDRSAALRCARRVPDFDRALRLAAALPASSTGAPGTDAASLDFIRRLRELVQGAAGAGVTLTQEEHQSLLAELDRAVRVPGAPTSRRPTRRTARPKGTEGG